MDHVGDTEKRYCAKQGPAISSVLTDGGADRASGTIGGVTSAARKRILDTGIETSRAGNDDALGIAWR
jgi:hypothetical protein